ncbi:hypothetical protein CWI36_0002p0010 [Hamiltosporidium magnivora]|uniref:Uncharacterized protein n=1 Tax=Hamiltosporidium magnivora TaxID=148818 RepID=A0A4Q9LMX6_9MICR|nr:hypothetical protein CWI36_0002p0010 [Hamiltosporidium magnivora]
MNNLLASHFFRLQKLNTNVSNTERFALINFNRICIYISNIVVCNYNIIYFYKIRADSRIKHPLLDNYLEKLYKNFSKKIDLVVNGIKLKSMI